MSNQKFVTGDVVEISMETTPAFPGHPYYESVVWLILGR